jgi:hypothetical protein
MVAKRLILTLPLCLFSLLLFSQVEETIAPEKNIKDKNTLNPDRWSVGLDFGFSFGSITYIKLAPDISYSLTPRLTIGVGPMYIYENYKFYDFNTSTYGGKAIMSFAVFRSKEHGGILSIGDIVFHIENEVINVEKLPYDYYLQRYVSEGRTWIDNLLVGGGLVQPISNKMNVALYLLWDVSQNTWSPYSNPIFKFGFNYTF